MVDLFVRFLHPMGAVHDDVVGVVGVDFFDKFDPAASLGFITMRRARRAVDVEYGYPFPVYPAAFADQLVLDQLR